MKQSREWAHFSTTAVKAKVAPKAKAGKKGDAASASEDVPPASAALTGTAAAVHAAAAESPAATTKRALDWITNDTIKEARAQDPGPEPADCLCMTTAKAFHGLQSMYPHLHHLASHVAVPETAADQHAHSVWAESLALHADRTWVPFLKTSYNTINAEVNRGRWRMPKYPM